MSVSYRVPKHTRLEGLLDYLIVARAGLLALPETEHLAPPLAALHTAVRAARDVRDERRARVLEAQALVRATRVRWARALVQLSGHAHLVAGKDPKAEPYVSLFGTATAVDLNRLGADRALEAGERLLGRARHLAHPAIAAQVDAFAAAHASLAPAVALRERAAAEALTLDTDRRRLLTEVESAIATAEVGVLQAFPGRRDLVRGLLSPLRPSRKARPGEDVGEDA